MRGGEAGWDKGAVLGSFAAAAVLLVAFAVVEVRASSPMLTLRFVHERDLAGAVLLIGIVLFAMFVTFSSSPSTSRSSRGAARSRPAWCWSPQRSA